MSDIIQESDEYQISEKLLSVPNARVLQLRPHQRIVKSWMNVNNNHKRLHLSHSTGCHRRGDAITTIGIGEKTVENIQIGDIVTNPYKEYSKVVALKRGREEMYQIKYAGGHFTVNSGHVFHLAHYDYASSVWHTMCIEFGLYEKLHANNVFIRGLPPFNHWSVIKHHKFSLPDRGIYEDINHTEECTKYAKCCSRHYELQGKCRKTKYAETWGVYGCIVYLYSYINQSYQSKKTYNLNTFTMGASEYIAHEQDILDCNNGDMISGITVTISKSYWCSGGTKYITLKRDMCKTAEYVIKRLGGIIINSREFIISQMLWNENIIESISFWKSGFVILLPFKWVGLGIDDYYGFTLTDPFYQTSDGIIQHNSGKTLAMCEIAHNYMTEYRHIYNVVASEYPPNRRYFSEISAKVPNVFIIGFDIVKSNFIKELMKYPEFGFISYDELNELNRLSKLTVNGTAQDIHNYSVFKSSIKRRIENKDKGGYFQFYGYDELVNRIFVTGVETLNELYAQITGTASAARNGENVSDELNIDEQFMAKVDEYISNGKIEVNVKLLESFKNSIILADEIHRSYNSLTKNNRGLAISYILRSDPSIVFVSASATPISNSPTEIVEIINYHSDTPVRKSDLFISNRKLKPDALNKIKTLMTGKYSFYQDYNPNIYPERIIRGDDLRIHIGSVSGSEYAKLHEAVEILSANSGKVVDIPYLKFDICVAPKFLWDVYREKYSSECYYVPSDAHALYDVVFPGSNGTVIYKSDDIHNTTMLANTLLPPNVTVIKSQSQRRLAGAWLQRANVSQYSTKLAKMLDILFDMVKGGHRKTIIFHDRVHHYGTDLICDCLMENGFIDESSVPTNNSICVYCSVTMGQHLHITDHQFAPTRFTSIHSYVNKTTIEERLSRFESPINYDGHEIAILVGGEKIKESYDFKCIQLLIMMRMPESVGTLMQVYGRGIRNGSHLMLPVEKRAMEIRTLICVGPQRDDGSYELFYEPYKYINKLANYKIAQIIEKELNSHALDISANYDKVFTPKQLREYWPECAGDDKCIEGKMKADTQSVLTFGTLFFTEIGSVMPRQQPGLEFAYYQISLVIQAIKHVFHDREICEVSELYELCCKLMFASGAKLDKHLYVIALQTMLNNPITSSTLNMSNKHKREHYFEKFANPDSTLVVTSIGIFKLTLLSNNHIVRYPYIPKVPSELGIPSKYIANTRNRETELINKSLKNEYEIMTYPESSNRTTSILTESVRINEYITNKNSDSEYDIWNDFYKRQGYDNFVLLTKTPVKFQIKLIAGIIELEFVTENTLETGVLDYYHKFGTILRYNDIAKYKHVLKLLPKDYGSLYESKYIGYCTQNDAHIYTGTDWISVNKLLINKHIFYKETGTCIGILQDSYGTTKFKLRPPTDKIKSKIHEFDIYKSTSNSEFANTSGSRSSKVRSKYVKKGDLRKYERGIVCNTKHRDELIEIASGLGIKFEDLDKNTLCDNILCALIQLETNERSTSGKYKYLYGWWDVSPSIREVLA